MLCSEGIDLLKDTFSNLMGVAVPALAAIFCIPWLIEQLGTNSFGVFSLQMAILFFLGVSDFGISKAIVLLSFDEHFSEGLLWQKPFLIGSYYSVLLALALSVLAVATWSVPLVELWDTPPEIFRSTGIIIMSSALMLLTLPFRAVYEVEQKFFLLNVIKGPAAASLFFSPLIGFYFEVSLESAAWSILATRLLFLMIFVIFSGVWVQVNFGNWNISTGFSVSRQKNLIFLRKAFALGVTNFSSLLITYMDRFLIALLVSSVAVTQFVISQEIVSKLWLVIGAAIIASVPKVASAREAMNLELVVSKIRELKLLVIGGGFLPAMGLVIFGDQILRFWLQRSYDPESTLPLQIMAIGIGLNALSQVNFSILQVFGGEARGAILQIGNLIFAFFALLILIHFYSIVGAAIAFTLRMVLDAIVVRLLLDLQDKSCRGLGVGLFAILLSLTFILMVFAGVYLYKPIY